MAKSDAQKLVEAEERLHDLKTGSLRNRIKDGDVEVNFVPPEVTRLERYIADLKAKLQPSTESRRRPAEFIRFSQ